MNDHNQEFYNRMEMQVRPSNRPLRRLKQQPLPQVNAWDVTMSDELLYQQAYAEEVPCVEILMPKDRLETIINYIKYAEDEIDKHTTDKKLIARYERDRVVRLNNPAVEKAYQHYCTLLELCRT
jgi:hypothetical protein